MKKIEKIITQYYNYNYELKELYSKKIKNWISPENDLKGNKEPDLYLLMAMELIADIFKLKYEYEIMPKLIVDLDKLLINKNNDSYNESIIFSGILETLWNYTELPENKEFKEKIRSFMGPKTRVFFDHPF